MDFSGIKVRKVNNTRVLIGEVIFKKPIGNEIMISINLLKKQGNEYKLTPYRALPTPFCDFCMKDTYLYPDVAKNSDLPEKMENECVFPAVRSISIKFNKLY